MKIWKSALFETFCDVAFAICLCIVAYPAMSLWLNKTGRPILFSCSWPAYQEGSMTVGFISADVWIERLLHMFLLAYAYVFLL